MAKTVSPCTRRSGPYLRKRFKQHGLQMIFINRPEDYRAVHGPSRRRMHPPSSCSPPAGRVRSFSSRSQRRFSMLPSIRSTSSSPPWTRPTPKYDGRHPGVAHPRVTEPVRSLSDPLRIAHWQPGEWTYRITVGERGGQMEREILAPIDATARNLSIGMRQSVVEFSE